MWSQLADVDFLELTETEEKLFLEIDIPDLSTEECQSMDFSANLTEQDSSSLYHITLSQIAETMENEHAVFNGIQDITISQTKQSYIDEPLDVTFDISLPDQDAEKLDVDMPIRQDYGRLKKPVTDSELKTLIENQENINTKSNTKWAYNVFEKWREQRIDDIPELHLMDSKTMNYWLQRFIVEATRRDGKEYPPKSLYLITCGLLRFLRNREIYDKNFLDENNVDFAAFRKILDAQMKTLLAKGLGTTTKQADPITREDEEKLWEVGVFGKEDATQLQHTVFFYASKLFGLRGCDEHHDLCCEQFEVACDENGKYVRFIGRATKTYKGGLGQLNVINKDIKHYCEPGERCIADYFYLYIDALGKRGSFYRKPLAPTNLIRYSSQNIGINKLKTFIKVICDKGGLKGNFTNHSGKRTCATQLYTANVDEQEIMSRTGHRSQTAVRKYKRTNDEICQNVSKILDPPKKKTDSDVKPPSPKSRRVVTFEHPPGGTTKPSPPIVLTPAKLNVNIPSASHPAATGQVFQNCEIHYWMS